MEELVALASLLPYRIGIGSIAGKLSHVLVIMELVALEETPNFSIAYLQLKKFCLLNSITIVGNFLSERQPFQK